MYLLRGGATRNSSFRAAQAFGGGLTNWLIWRKTVLHEGQQTHQAADDPVKALAFKLEFLANEHEEIAETKTQAEDMGRLPLSRVAELYFEWKAASSAWSQYFSDAVCRARCAS